MGTHVPICDILSACCKKNVHLRPCKLIESNYGVHSLNNLAPQDMCDMFKVCNKLTNHQTISEEKNNVTGLTASA